MPFSLDSIPSRLGSIPDIGRAPNLPELAVYPTAALVGQAMKEVESILDNFSPLKREERELQIQTAMTKTYLQKKMFEAAKAGDMESFAVYSGKTTEMDFELKKQQFAVRKAKSERDNAPKPPSIVDSKIIARQKAHAAWKKAQPAPPADTPATGDSSVHPVTSVNDDPIDIFNYGLNQPKKLEEKKTDDDNPAVVASAEQAVTNPDRL